MNYMDLVKNSDVVVKAANLLECPLDLSEIDPANDKGMNYWFLLYIRYIALCLEKDGCEAVTDEAILSVVDNTKRKAAEILIANVLREYSENEECGKAEFEICGPHIKKAPIYLIYGAHKKVISAFGYVATKSA
jgi:hypothetical protein